MRLGARGVGIAHQHLCGGVPASSCLVRSLVAKHEVKNCYACLSAEFGMPANASLCCGCHLCGRLRRWPWGADGESIVMDQRVSWLQPWVSECREQQQLYLPPSLFYDCPLISPSFPRVLVPLFFCFISNIPDSPCLWQLFFFFCGILAQVTLPVLVFASISQRLICKITKCCYWRQRYLIYKTFVHYNRAVLKFHFPTSECNKDTNCEFSLFFVCLFLFRHCWCNNSLFVCSECIFFPNVRSTI